jgi:hypothetical protein
MSVQLQQSGISQPFFENEARKPAAGNLRSTIAHAGGMRRMARAKHATLGT